MGTQSIEDMGTTCTAIRATLCSTIKSASSRFWHHNYNFLITELDFLSSRMMRILCVIAALVLCASANNPGYDKLFQQYAGADNLMDCTEMGNYWAHYDTDGDGNVSKYEFDTQWRREDIGEKSRAPFFFLELDRVPDEQLNILDYPHICHLFDENGDGSITKREFEFNWKGLFESD